MHAREPMPRRRNGLLLLGLALGALFVYQAAMYMSMAASLNHSEAQRSHTQNAAASEPMSTMPKLRSDELKTPVRNTTLQTDRGIIMCLHEGIVAMGVSLIRELRCLGNQEIIQVYHCLNELSEESQALLTRHDPHVEVIDVCQRMLDAEEMENHDQAKSFQSYWIKPLALYYTNFTEVILMDADDVMMKDPAVLRDLEGYKTTGTLFFYDRVVPYRKFFNRHVKVRQQVNGETRITQMQMLQALIRYFDYAQFGLSGFEPSQRLLNSMAYTEQTCHEQDSSLLLIDKSKAGKAMEVLKFLIFKTRFKHRFSWGDKEAFWLAYEFAHQPYYFTPYGLSLINSVPNDDLKEHPETMCASMAHWTPPARLDIPIEESKRQPDLLYVNGKAMLEPFPQGLRNTLRDKISRMYNINPTHVTPPYAREEYDTKKRYIGFECINEMGSMPLPPIFRKHLMRRRLHFLAVKTGYHEPLDSCLEF